MVENQSEDCSSNYQYLNSKTVQIIANGATVSYEDQVDVGDAAEDEEDFDGCVVQWYKIEKEINISCEEH